MFVMVALASTAFAKEYDFSDRDYNPAIQFKEIPYEISPTAPRHTNYTYGNEDYPIVRTNEAFTIYLDNNSCNYHIKICIDHVSCPVYYGGGGLNGHGNVARYVDSVFRSSTCKKSDGKRVIMFLGETNSRNMKMGNTVRKIIRDNGFLKNLFWKARK